MNLQDLNILFKNHNVEIPQAEEITNILCNRVDPIIYHLKDSEQRFQRIIDSHLSEIFDAIKMINKLHQYVINDTKIEYMELSSRLLAIYAELESVKNRQYKQISGQVFLKNVNPREVFKTQEAPIYQGGYLSKEKQLNDDYKRYIDTFDNTVKKRDIHVISFYMIAEVLEDANHKSPKKTANAIIDDYYETSLKSKKRITSLSHWQVKLMININILKFQNATQTKCQTT